ncbi:cyclase/dehydrase [Polynucleobacter paneuropaeus]|nr:cyclase/dehydrase [Polynucleobacter paneuropaeus]MBT8554479.1 cyclase/dehydrase [Polynucleobacter paneuropaeus]MBT8559756.1 cyclase/dehydrase [Polynucleobacter paneuropaeus]MBT8595120.1 cyclase/dehydrase [Polynucleobacter paneuropaeus]QWD32847.1 cyclase/dehydrase [Polynucleobacter paneuropaeus]
MKPLLSGLFIAATLITFGWSQIATAQTTPPDFDLKVSVQKAGDAFQVSASFLIPATECQTYTMLTDYESAAKIPGIKKSVVISREANKVRVERDVKERILFFPINLHSIVEYEETPTNLLTFHQISGDVEYYRGTWKIQPEEGSARLQYQSEFAIDTLIPSFVAQYFIKNNIRSRFEAMATNFSRKKETLGQLACN